jgi:hypothetical protein
MCSSNGPIASPDGAFQTGLDGSFLLDGNVLLMGMEMEDRTIALLCLLFAWCMCIV